jgi:hypothetical protein
VPDLAALQRLHDIVAAALREQGDRVCWRDIYNPEVAALVGVTFDPALLPRGHFLANCEHFYDCLAADRPYVTPPADGRRVDVAFSDSHGRVTYCELNLIDAAGRETTLDIGPESDIEEKAAKIRSWAGLPPPGPGETRA